MGLFSRSLRMAASGYGSVAAKLPAPRNECAYPSVEVLPSQGSCCQAAREIAGQRILAEDAPCLPLTNCDQAVCNCKYKRYADRRTDIRRDVDIGIGMAASLYNQDCRRSRSRGRRDED